MSEHEHDHEPAVLGIPVDPDETARLRAEADAEGATTVGHFLRKAEHATTLRERTFWMGKVDSARYFAELEKTRERLDQRARENMEAEARLLGTEATLELLQSVGNAVVLKLKPGEKKPPGWPAAGYSLIRRIAGETGTEGYGAPPYGDQWVPQGLRMNVVHEFAVVSEDSRSAKRITGPWLAVPIGNVSTAEIQAADRAAADKEYQEREDAEAERQRQHSADVAERRRARQEALTDQQAQADIDNAARERRRIEREEAHRKAVAELPLVRPREIAVRLRGLPDGRILADLEWLRGTKRPLYYKVKLNGTVLGDDPGGQWSGAKPDGHRYTRTVEVPKGAPAEFVIAGVTNHGDGEHAFTIPVPESLCEPEDETPAPAPAQPSRMDRIVAAVKSYSGRRTRDGRPWVRPLRKHAGMPDITTGERNKAHRTANGS